MNKIHTALVVIVGFSLLALSAYLKNHGDGIVYRVANIDKKCADAQINCSILDSVFKELYNSGAGIKRQSISKNDLPVVRIYMSDGAVEKLDAKRKSVLAKVRPIHLTESNDWVKATVMVELDQNKEKSKTSIRLKGDWGDHMEDPKKLSFRVKTRGGGYLFGMKSFSIQHPATRNFGNEPLLLDQMRSHDILAPRYRFVDVYVNDYPIGVMAMEEHFRKEMIEAQNRRDGPLMAINEDPLWEQWDINYNSVTPTGNGAANFSGHRDSMIKDFNKSDFKRGTIPTNNSIRGQALFRDFLDGKMSSREVFDYEKLSKYWILVNIWGGCHSSIWHNRRFYFNPISGLLEPVGFDNIPHPENYKLCSDFDVKAALQDPQFLTQVTLSAEKIYEQLQSTKYYNSLREKQKLQTKIFDYEQFPHRPKTVTPEILIKNLRQLLVDISTEYEALNNYERAYVPQAPKLIGKKFLELESDINLHMSSFYYPQNDGGSFEFRNLTLKPISIKTVYASGKKGRKTPVEFAPSELASSLNSSGLIEIPAEVSDEVLSKHSEFVVEYSYDGALFKRPVYVQLRNHNSGFVADPIAAIRSTKGHKWVDIKGRQVVFAAGPHNFNQSIALPKGWRAIVQAGAELNFRNGALLKLQGPLIVQGSELKPVVMNVESDIDYLGMGSWGGLLVSKASSRSSVRYLNLKGTGVQNLSTRQGYYGMTGCLSFYESDVDISNSIFLDAQCEDALNIVKSDFKLDNIVIEGARADAFDSDFSTGVIANSKFISSGNDGIDVSGTTLHLRNVTMRSIGDKAVSVGEKSTLSADGIFINGAVLGLVSKDLSDAKAKNVRFEDISGTAIMTYIKKPEYGPSRAECEDCTFLGDFTQVGAQAKTVIQVNGRIIRQSTLTQTQMRDAGLIEEGA